MQEGEGEGKCCARCSFCAQHVDFCSSNFMIFGNVLSLGLMFLYKYETGGISHENESLMSV
jgi:hypothetical protein